MLPFPVLAINFGPPELLLALLLILLLFGATKIPQLARSLGKAKAEYQKGAREGDRELASGAAPDEDSETILRTARELGVPTEGRSLADVKADIRRKLA